jgi:hypothetical protein
MKFMVRMMPKKTIKAPNKIEDLVAKYGMSTRMTEAIMAYITNGVRLSPADHALATFFLKARSKTELAWHEVGKGLIAQEMGTPVLMELYEGMGFKLPAASYWPDFDYLLDNGLWAFVEIKASIFQSNYRDARSKLRSAASLNPWHTFIEARPEKGGVWVLERIKPELSIIKSFNLD